MLLSFSFVWHIFADKLINTKKERCELKWCDISLLYIYLLNTNKINFTEYHKWAYYHFLYWHLKILKHFIFSFFVSLVLIHSKISFKRIWTSLTLILSSKVVCIWPHWRPTKSNLLCPFEKRNAFNALDRTILLNRRDFKTHLRASIKRSLKAPCWDQTCIACWRQKCII